MSGHALTESLSCSPAWHIVSQWLPQTKQSKPWWTTVGPHLGTLARESNYTTEKQFEILLFLYAKVLPRVGTFYNPGQSDWPSRHASLLTNDGSPFEYSWKWNSPSSGSTPEVRYCIEAIGSETGTSNDPFNYLETERMLVDDLVYAIPGLDLTWFHHFVKAFSIDERQPAPSNSEAPSASMFVAFEHVAKGSVVKAYFLPSTDNESGGPPTFGTFANAARGILSKTDALDAVLSYVQSDSVGSTLSPDMLAIDCIDTEKSRLKLYASSPTASIATIVSVMTLGGKIMHVDQSIGELVTLLRLVLGLEDDSSWTDDLNVQDPFDRDLAHTFDLYGRMTYYFDIAPSSKLPDVKLYIPVIRYAKTDAAVASGLGQYLRVRQRDQYYAGFERALEKIGESHPNGNGHRLQTYLAVAFQPDGSLAITSYINPGFYHADLKANSSKAEE